MRHLFYLCRAGKHLTALYPQKRTNPVARHPTFKGLCAGNSIIACLNGAKETASLITIFLKETALPITIINSPPLHFKHILIKGFFRINNAL